MPLLHRSITEPEEPELVSHVLNDVQYRDTLLNIHGMETRNARILECVPLSELRHGLNGDVDVLVIPAGRPELSTAIQVKRFEATVRMNAEGLDESVGLSPQRFRKLMAKGIKQANLTKLIGFSQVYLWVFVVIDTRARNSGWYTYEGADSLLRSQIEYAISPAGLHPTIGLMKFEWVQPMDRPPFELSTQAGDLKKLATLTPQPDELTERLTTLPARVLQLPERCR